MPECDFNKVAIEITLRRGSFPVNLLDIFRTAFSKNISGGQLLVHVFLTDISSVSDFIWNCSARLSLTQDMSTTLDV